MQTRSPFFDELAKTMENAMGVAQAMGEEAKAAVRGQADRMAAELDLVRRDEFDVMKAMFENGNRGAAFRNRRFADFDRLNLAQRKTRVEFDPARPGRLISQGASRSGRSSSRRFAHRKGAYGYAATR